MIPWHPISELPDGMKPWHGGDEPNDWDGGRVQTRDGSVYLHENAPDRWRHNGGSLDIVAYTPTPQLAP